MNGVVNIVLAGLGGQGVIKASDILAESAFRFGQDVKKAEVHGMSQRGGSVATDVRFGPRVESPMVPVGEADFLVVFDASQIDTNKHMLKPGGKLIAPDALGTNEFIQKNPKSLNTALLGVLSRELPIPEELWLAALKASFAERFLETNRKVFLEYRNANR